MPDPGHPDSRPRWGEQGPGVVARALAALRRVVGERRPWRPAGLPQLPLRLRRGELAAEYLGAERAGDHRRAGAASEIAMERAIATEDWWQADVWAHRALWHFERAEMTLQAVRLARRIGDIRSAGGDPSGARRYYAEAIDEARDIGAEHEQGLAAVGLGRALFDLGDVTTARRLGRAAAELLTRSGAPPDELAIARSLQGTEKAVGEVRREEEGA